MDRVHLEFIGNTSRYIHTYALRLRHFFYCLFHKFLVRMMIKFRIREEKEKEEDTIKRPQQNVSFFFFQLKLVKRSGVAYF